MKQTSRWIVSLLALTAGACASRTHSEAPRAQAPDMTCAEFLSLDDSIKPRAVAWMDGYSAGRRQLAVGEVEVDRETNTLVVMCEQNPKMSFWDRVKEHLPHGKTTIKPVSMTCEEFVELDETVRPEAVYWLDGYDAATRTDVSVAGEIDLQRDTNVVLVECKQAPKESLWSKIKSKF